MPQSECELCNTPETSDHIEAFEVPPPATLSNVDLDQASVQICRNCGIQLKKDPAEFDPRHWRCLQASIWSENPAVKVLAWRILKNLSRHATGSWAQDLLEQIYLDQNQLAWAEAGFNSGKQSDSPQDQNPITRDSNGTVLSEGDSVTLIKDLEVKGAGFTAKRGTLVKGIHLTQDPGLIEGRVNGTQIVLKTQFLKKA